MLENRKDFMRCPKSAVFVTEPKVGRHTVRVVSDRLTGYTTPGRNRLRGYLPVKKCQIQPKLSIGHSHFSLVLSSTCTSSSSQVSPISSFGVVLICSTCTSNTICHRNNNSNRPPFSLQRYGTCTQVSTDCRNLQQLELSNFSNY